MRTLIWAGLALLLLTLGMFAVFSPFNGATNDEWSYLYAGQQGEWHGRLVNRPFAMGSAVIAAWALPDRPQNLFVFHLFFTFLISLGIFHLANRLLGRAWLALIWAGFYLVYIPFNMDASRALFIQTYSWAILILVLSLILLLEFAMTAKLAWAVGAALLGYMAARVYEGFIPLLWVLGALFFYLGQRKPLYGWLAWYGGIGAGTLAFLLPFFRGEAQYQNREQGTVDWLARIREFLSLTFPLESEILPTQLNYLLPALLLTGLFLLVVWRFLPVDGVFLSPQIFIMALFLNLVLLLVSALALIYANLHTEPRAQFLAAPFAAGVLLCLMALLALAGQFFLRIPPQWTSLFLAGLVLVLGLQWSLEAQIWAAEKRGPAFDQKTPFFRQMQAFIPALPPHSAIIYQCESPQKSLHLARLADLFAVSYLYGADVPLILDPFHIAPLRSPVLELKADSLSYTHEYDLGQVGPRKFEFAYADVVLLACDGEGIYIQEKWRGDYNPYARIRAGWLENERVLNR